MKFPIRIYRTRWLYADHPKLNFTTAFHIDIFSIRIRIPHPRARKLLSTPLFKIKQGGLL